MVFTFGDHRLDIDRRELRWGAEVVRLEPQVFDLLAYLVQHRDRVVSKEDLRQAIWGGRIVSYSALAGRINAVRRALGDDGAAQRLVRTFARKGVRFVGDVDELPQPSAGGAGPLPSLALPDKPSIAVLPFQNLSNEPDQEYFADGIVEEITTAIARFPSLFVIARNSSFIFKGRTIDVAQIASELGVRYVLEGSVRKAGKRVRITAQLIDTDTGGHIWADRVDSTLEDIFDLQDHVASSVAGAIEPCLRLAEIKRATHKPTDNLVAYDLYLQGMALSYERTRESLAKSIDLAHQALKLDPNYALAMSKVAVRRVLQLARNWISPCGPEVCEGIAMARQALALALNDSDVLDAAGSALAFLAGENETALAAINRAIVLNPNLAIAFGHRAAILAWLNRPDEAICAAEQARCLSPSDPAAFSFSLAEGVAHLVAGRYEAAMWCADRALSENGGAPALRLKLSLCGHLERLTEVKDCLRRLYESHPDPTIAKLIEVFPKGMSRGVIEQIVEGLRKAGLSEK